MATEKQYAVETRFLFEGHFFVKAQNKAQAKEYIEKHCGVVLGGDIHSTLTDNSVNWEFPIHPVKQIGKAVQAQENMKKYLLVIDTSASSPESSLYVFKAKTIKEAKSKLAELRLIFASGYIYCATIGEKEPGLNNSRYRQIERTDNGKDWYKECDSHAYNPEKWMPLDDWANIDYYQKERSI